MHDSEANETARATNRRRVLAVVVMAVVGLALAVPLTAGLRAKSECRQSSGDWRSELGGCDYGPGGAVVRLLEQSKRCQGAADSGLRECAYAVDRLKIDIIGVGSSRASFSVDGSDEDLGYGVGVFMDEGCIRVAPGTRLKERDPMRRIEDGFVSTWTGEVYDSLTVCAANGRNVRAAGETAAREK